MDAFGVLNDVLTDYELSVRGYLNIRDPDIRNKTEQEVADGLLWPGPWLAPADTHEVGARCRGTR